MLLTVPAACAASGDAPHPTTSEARMSPKLYRVIQPVTDIEAATRFYSVLFEQPGERVSPGRHYFDLGGTILAVYDPVADGDALGEGWRRHANQYVYVAVADLEAALARARAAGATIQAEIAAMPWGERLFYALDPFGNPICLVDESTLFMGGGD
jgi:predicted enzyme related to lactoylglutathione lyase